MVTEVDVLVIGAGPAGSTAAKHAAMGGASVLLIDKKSEIGAPKRCAEGVSVGGLESLGIEPNPRWITKKLDGVRLVSPNGTDVWLTSDKVELPEAGYILERKVFDKHMAMDAARAGSEIMVKTLATGMEKTDDGYLVSAECMGREFEIKARIVIAADGPESRVARWAGLNTATKPKDMESAAQFEMVGVEMEDNNCIEFYFGSVAPGGYAWIFPKGDDIANVGLGVLSTETDKSAYEHLVEFVESCPATRNAQPVELNIGGDPVGGMPKELVADSLMVVGDAAGQVNPLTGGGIISGMTGGMLAGRVAAAAVSEGDVSKKRLSEYERLCREEIGKEIDRYLKVKDYMLTLSDSELDSIAEAFQDVEFEKVSTTELVKKLIKVSPKALIKLGKLF
ncbi:NAD(P)/FAD-dependent oxidoreductase [Methanothermobacter marburgensis]|uniref:Digeranylgeranylglycerophospholipid reductase n=1 Tax=Methanothermobacter marburgensis (strain ATCC BAA-927 / DSM 2133 / JCM 14651 / NBRC 100331 / OCM 82 / Marburg) TaxID=79929 RepID=D9PVS3_METTM|nr:NAD(P)/FAD-dependent oxidoreductase [Methanothermobacter marburgensis]ADL58321.1 predicted dehydrogenase [Methanothermobacter marburgensis str. Marburg]WBF10476.1 NAD(P)/FAD-dependent oxidoreductase [Methanothermobacter marburgensis]